MVSDGEYFQAAVEVTNGRISAIHRNRSNAADPSGPVLDATDALILPGFVQCHVHVVQSLLRHQADGLELLDWLRRRTWPYEAALSGDDVFAAARLGITELLCGGTTTALDFGTTHHHDRVFEAAEQLGIRFVSGLTHMDEGDGAPDALLRPPAESLAEAASLGERWHGAANGRISYAVAPRFALSCSAELLEASVQLARSHGWLIQTHASENRGEIDEVRRRFGCSNIEYLHRHGLTGHDVVLAHGVHLEPSEIELLARTGTRICHCPGTNLKLASGIADVVAMLAAGVVVGLGADGAPCNNRLSAFHEMSLAGTLHGLRHGPTALSPWKVLALATRDGARALHLDGEIGTLEVGKRADLVVIDARDWAMQPGGNPASRIVYGATSAQVRHAVVDGRPVVIDGRPVAVDPRDVLECAQAAWTATAKRMEM